jgi:hypothetical protein
MDGVGQTLSQITHLADFHQFENLMKRWLVEVARLLLEAGALSSHSQVKIGAAHPREL